MWICILNWWTWVRCYWVPSTIFSYWFAGILTHSSRQKLEEYQRRFYIGHLNKIHIFSSAQVFFLGQISAVCESSSKTLIWWDKVHGRSTCFQTSSTWLMSQSAASLFSHHVNSLLCHFLCKVHTLISATAKTPPQHISTTLFHRMRDVEDPKRGSLTWLVGFILLPPVVMMVIGDKHFTRFPKIKDLRIFANCNLAIYVVFLVMAPY